MKLLLLFGTAVILMVASCNPVGQAFSAGGQCSSDADCGSGSECITEYPPAYCQQKECKENVDCGSGAHCEYGYCSEDGTDCTVASDCSASNYGETVVCEYGTCLYTAPGACSEDIDCGNGYTCVTQYPPAFCQQKTCNENVDCGSGAHCEYGYCSEDGTDCASANDCSASYYGETVTCDYGYCVYTATGACVIDTDCENGFECITNTPPAYCQQKSCTADGDCGDGLYCDYGYCYTFGSDCAVNVDCPQAAEGYSSRCNRGYCLEELV